MPSVRMSRRTKVGGVVKGPVGARVLRSGRRIWDDEDEGKLKRHKSGDELLHVKKNTRNSSLNAVGNVDSKASRCAAKELTLKQPLKMDFVALDRRTIVEKMFGKVYSRKRKRTGFEMGMLLRTLDDRKYGKRFSRRQRSRTKKNYRHLDQNVLNIVVGEAGCWWFPSFFSSLLECMRWARVKMVDLGAFLMSDPIHGVYCSHGIRFSLGHPAVSIGICKFFETRQSIPSFSVDFSAVFHCFVYIHLSRLLSSELLWIVTVNKSLYLKPDDKFLDDIVEEDHVLISSLEVVETRRGSVVMLPKSNENKAVLHPSIRASKLVGRNGQYKLALSSRSVQKRRSSLRRRRSRNPSLVGLQKANGNLVSDMFISRRNVIPFSSVVSKNKLRSSDRSSCIVNLRDVGSTMVDIVKDTDSTCCSANILAFESDRCYREEGATVMLELASSGEWFLAMKKNGSTLYSHRAQSIMRPCSSNRFTHAIIWGPGDDNWKLEFLNRQDWCIFKDLYKECSDRNAPLPISKAIPVPGVQEVLGYDVGSSATFYRPDSYISVRDDEISRALAKKNAIYDMDYEDEEWLKKFNNEYFSVHDLFEHISEEKFELMVDAFEKAFYCNPEECANEKAAANLCLDLGSRELVDAVYQYWLKKRKQRRAPLLRVFQGQAKKSPVIPKPLLRKRRSFKRQASHGRGKPPSALEAIAEEDGFEEQNAMHNVEEAKVSASRCVESAILKRQRAQVLLENADLAAYKAMMAVRIAEAALIVESPEGAADQFLRINGNE